VRIVVTGAQGFIGSALTRRLSRDGHQVVAVGRRPRRQALPGVTTVQADCAIWGWTDLLPGNADLVVHLAQSPRYGQFPEGAMDVVRVNVDSTAELLDWSRRHGVTRFVLASTATVYQSTSKPLAEDAALVSGNFYAASKLSAEHMARAYGDHFHVVVARLFGAYGPGQMRGLFRTVIDSVAVGRAVTLAGERGLSISTLYIDDCIDALVRLIGLPARKGETLVNLASDHAVDIRAIAEAAAVALKKEPVFERKGGDAPALVADTARLSALLGWRPAVSLEDGVARMIGQGT
jgi:UDP-glucose 4-epimerase